MLKSRILKNAGRSRTKASNVPNGKRAGNRCRTFHITGGMREKRGTRRLGRRERERKKGGGEDPSEGPGGNHIAHGTNHEKWHLPNCRMTRGEEHLQARLRDGNTGGKKEVHEKEIPTKR